jgi:hypothetical protein
LVGQLQFTGGGGKTGFGENKLMRAVMKETAGTRLPPAESTNESISVMPHHSYSDLNIIRRNGDGHRVSNRWRTYVGMLSEPPRAAGFQGMSVDVEQRYHSEYHLSYSFAAVYKRSDRLLNVRNSSLSFIESVEQSVLTQTG